MYRLCSCCVMLFLVAMTTVRGGCGPSSPPISVTLFPSSAQAIDQGQTVAITATVTNDTSYRGVSRVLTGPGILGNMTETCVTYNAPSTNLTSAQQATVTATSIADKTKSAAVQITVNPNPQIPFQTLANGTVSTPYSQTIALTGGTPPFQWNVYDGPIITGWRVGGAVPDGLTLDPSIGTISGTPTGGGTWYFEATVTDAAGMVAINGFMSVQINSIAALGNPVPFLNQPLWPTAVSRGGLGFTLSVSGAGFVSSATIDFNPAPLVTTFVDSEHLTATVPAADVASAGTAAVTVVNPGPGGGASNVVYFQVAAPETAVNFTGTTLSLQNHMPAGITTGDFNEDGRPDLAVAADVWVHILLGNGDGTFGAPPGSPMPVASPPYNDEATPLNTDIVAGDFNHSGQVGLAVADQPNAAAYILLGKGHGTFSLSSAALANSVGWIDAIVTADFNGDGNLDLAFQGPVVLGYRDGAFSAAQQSVRLGYP
jgi:hypothetical protein